MAYDIQKPKVDTKTVFTKRVSLKLPEELVEEIIKEWLTHHVPQFRGTEIEVGIGCGGYEGCRFSCEAVGTKNSEK